jgi:hypothetical protein
LFDAKEGDWTVVCKLGADKGNEEPSRMRVIGAGTMFAYGPLAGASGAFISALWHSSAPHLAPTVSMKAVFFFKETAPRMLLK